MRSMDLLAHGRRGDKPEKSEEKYFKLFSSKSLTSERVGLSLMTSDGGNASPSQPTDVSLSAKDL